MARRHLSAAVVAVAALALTVAPASQSAAGPLPKAGAVQRLLAGIPQKGNVLGSPRAPVTLVEYIDLQCPICRDFETAVMARLIPRYVRAGKVKVEARPIAFIGPDSVRGLRATIAASRQNKLFNFSLLLYDNQGTENTGWLDKAMVARAAASVPGLSASRLLAVWESDSITKQAQRYITQAQADHVKGTPTVLIGRSGARLHEVGHSYESVAAAIAAGLHR